MARGNGDPRHDPEDEGAAQLPPGTRLSLSAALARLTDRRTFLALQLGASLIAVVGGLVVYSFLISVRLNVVVALLIAVVFSFLARQAAISLALEWLLRRARQRDPDQAGTSSPPDMTRPRR